MARRLIRGVFAAALVAVVVLSVLPELPSSEVSHSDKLAHLAAYAVLGGLALLSAGGRRGRALLPAWVVVLGFALEGVQAALPWRTASWGDAAANLAGVGLGAAAALLALRARP